jgi:hypothetical protein
MSAPDFLAHVAGDSVADVHNLRSIRWSNASTR